jgi:hypothetical protein
VNFSSFESGQYQYLVLVQAHPVQQISYPIVGVGWPDLEWKAGTAQDTGTGRSDVAGEISLIDLLTTHGSGTGSGAVLKDSVYLCARTVFMSSVAINPVPLLSIGRMSVRGRHSTKTSSRRCRLAAPPHHQSPPSPLSKHFLWPAARNSPPQTLTSGSCPTRR